MLNKSIFSTLFPYLKQDEGNDPSSQGADTGAQNDTPYTIGPDDGPPAPPVSRGDGNPYQNVSVPIMGGGQTEDSGVVNPYTPSPGMDDMAPLVHAIVKKNNPNYEMSDYDKTKQNYTTALSAPIQHQNPYLNALFVGLQGADHFFNRNNQNPIQFLGEAKHNKQVQQAYQQYAPLEALEAQKGKAAQEQSEADLKKAQADYYSGRNDVARKDLERKASVAEKANMTRQYNALPKYDENDPDDKQFGDAFEKTFGYRPPSKNAKTQSKQIIDNRNGQVYLDQTDAQGGHKLVQLMKNDNTPFTVESNAMLSSEDKKEQRELQEKLQDSRNVTQVKVAQIGAGSRVDVANINQAGANGRQDKSLAQQREEFIQNYQQKISQDKAKNTFNKVGEMTKLETAHHNHQMDNDTYNAMKAVLDQQ